MAATSTHGKINSALNDRLIALVLSPPLPIAFPNMPLTPAGANYLRVDYLPNQTRQITMRADEPQQFRGIYQVAVMWQRNQGMIKPLDTAGLIVNHFKGLTLWANDIKVTIDQEPWAASPLIEPDAVMIPVSIQWHAFEPEV